MAVLFSEPLHHDNSRGMEIAEAVFHAAYHDCVFAGAYIMALHMYYLVRCMWLFLANKFGTRFFVVFEWVMKTEYQGRGTPHWHIAAWIVSFGLLNFLVGRTGTAVVSVFVKLWKYCSTASSTCRSETAV